MASTRGRPKSAAKKQRIYDAASHLFLEHGYEGVSMDQVADFAGVSKQTVYSHFDSKERLFSACVEEKCVARQLGEEFFDPNIPARDMLMQIAWRFSELMLSREAVRIKRIICSHNEGSVLPQLYYQAGAAHMQQNLAHYLDGQVERGALTIEDTLVAARQLLFMLQGDAHLKALINLPEYADTAELKRYVTACVDLFLSAYQAPPANA